MNAGRSHKRVAVLPVIFIGSQTFSRSLTGHILESFQKTRVVTAKVFQVDV